MPQLWHISTNGGHQESSSLGGKGESHPGLGRTPCSCPLRSPHFGRGKLSGSFRQGHKWSLYLEVIRLPSQWWSTLDVDLLASRFNAKLERFRTRDSQAFAVDALMAPWDQFFLIYVFTPIQIILHLLTYFLVGGNTSDSGFFNLAQGHVICWHNEHVCRQFLASFISALSAGRGPIFQLLLCSLALTALLLRPEF